MYSKTITYKDYNNEEQTETFWFNMNEDEVAKLEYSAMTSNTMGIADKLSKIARAVDGKGIADTIEEFIALSFGERSTDGARFMKSPESYAFFKSTRAYSKLYFELATDANLFVEFVEGLLPSNLEEITEEVKKKHADVQRINSENARKRSEAMMEGFKKAQIKPQPVETVTSETKITQTYEPTLELATVSSDQAITASTLVPSQRPDLWPAEAGGEPEGYAEFMAWKANQKQASEQQ